MAISKTVRPDGRVYLCDDCKNEVARFKSIRLALQAGWAVARGRSTCYCPKCAPKHRHTGCKGGKPKQPLTLPNGWEQTVIKL